MGWLAFSEVFSLIAVERNAADDTLFERSAGIRNLVCSSHLNFTFQDNINYCQYVSAKANKPLTDGIFSLTTYFSGWRVRFYHGLKSDTREESRLLCHVYCYYNNVGLCDVNQLISSIAAVETKGIDLPVTSWELIRLNRMNWRYIPMIDEQVDRMLARDADSEINIREAAAVSQWLESGFTFHVMRDHPSHKREIMGGKFWT
jgi:hypothetical protein